MFAHAGLQHLGREAQKILADPAHQRHRPFDQPRHFGQQTGIRHNLHSRRKGKVLRALPDRGLTLGAVQHDMRALQFHRVVVKARNGKPPDPHEAVAFGGVARDNPVHRQRHDRRTRLVGQQAQDASQGPHPAQGAVAPAHRLGPGEAADRGVQHLGHDLGRFAAGLFDDGIEGFALLVGAAFQLVKRQAG